jgi:hypothetical protein
MSTVSGDAVVILSDRYRSLVRVPWSNVAVVNPPAAPMVAPELRDFLEVRLLVTPTVLAVRPSFDEAQHRLDEARVAARHQRLDEHFDEAECGRHRES